MKSALKVCPISLKSRYINESLVLEDSVDVWSDNKNIIIATVATRIADMVI